MNSLLRQELESGFRLQQQGKFQEAESIYGAAIAKNPDAADPIHALGVARYEQGDFSGAVEAINRAILIDATQALYFNNYGAALQGAGRCADAIAAYRAALQLQPDYLDPSINLVRALSQQLQWKAAFRMAGEAIDRWPNSTELLRLGALAADNSQMFEAAVRWLGAYLKLVRDGNSLPKDFAAYLSRYGEWLIQLGRGKEAVQALREATDREGHNEEYWHQLSRAHSIADEIDFAQDAIGTARRIAPRNKTCILAELTTDPRVFPSEAALRQFRSDLEARLDDLLQCGESLPREAIFKANFIPPYGLGFHGECSRAIKEKFALLCQRSFSLEALPRPSTGKPRIGVVVTRGHEELFLRCMGGIFRRFSPARFQLIVMCDSRAVQKLRGGLRRSDIEFIPLDHHFRRTVNNAVEANCDLLYYWEIGSDSLNYFLPITRPAHLQCLSWGSQCTSGMRAVDYFVSSQLVSSPEMQRQYTEQIIELSTLPTWQERLPVSPRPDRSFFGFSQKGNLYVCPQNIMKCQPAQDALWGLLLREDSSGTLVFKESRNPGPATIFRERLAKAIPDVAERVKFVPWLARDDFYRLLVTADVLVDPPGFSAGSSAYDIFSLNRAVVTLPGPSFVSRFTAGCYRKMQFTDMIVTDYCSYVGTATRLAGDPDYRSSVLRSISEQSGSLFNDGLAVTEHERVFEEAVHTMRLQRA